MKRFLSLRSAASSSRACANSRRSVSSRASAEPFMSFFKASISLRSSAKFCSIISRLARSLLPALRVAASSPFKARSSARAASSCRARPSSGFSDAAAAAASETATSWLPAIVWLKASDPGSARALNDATNHILPAGHSVAEWSLPHIVDAPSSRSLHVDNHALNVSGRACVARSYGEGGGKLQAQFEEDEPAIRTSGL